MSSCLRVALAFVLVALLGCGRSTTAGGGPSAGSSTSPPVGSSATAADGSAPRPTASGPGDRSVSPPPAASAAPASSPGGPLAGGWPPPVVDLHVDTVWKVNDQGRAASLPEGHVTAQKLREGRYHAVVFALYIPDRANERPSIRGLDDLYATVEKIVAANDLLQLAPPLPAAIAAPGTTRQGQVQVLLGIEGAEAFARDVGQIDRFIAKGVRLVGPVHSRDNSFSGSATGRARSGLSDLGRTLCRRVYERGALVDVSHMSDAAFWDLVSLATEAHKPVVASHSNARAICNHERNLSDEQLAAIAKSGGLAGLNLHRKFVRRSNARLEHVVEQVLHLVRVAGIDHVALGTDFDGGQPVPGLEDASRLPALAEALRTSGLGEGEVRKIFHGNALRVLGSK